MPEKRTEIGRVNNTSNSYDLFPASPLDGTVVRRNAEDIGLPLTVLCWRESLRYDGSWFRHVNYVNCALEMVLEGEMAYLSDGRRFVVRKGELFLMVLGSNARFARTEVAARVHKICLIFSGFFVGILLHFLGIKQDCRFKVDSPEWFEREIREIIRLLEENSPSALRRSSARLYNLLLELSVFARQREEFGETRLGNMVRYQDLRISMPLGNGDLQKILFLKHSALNDLYRKNLGVTPHRFHRDRRLEQAAELLRTTSISVRDAALECGFPNYKYFLVIFRKKFGITPGKYRLERREGASPGEISF